MANFIRAANPIWYMVDLQGLGLNDEYYAFFLQNVDPYNLQNVYMDDNASQAWANPLQFMPNGTLPNNLYFNDEQTYRIEIRQGNNQSTPFIYQVNDFQPSGEQVMPASETLISLNNIITNSQFSEVSFTGTLALTSPGTFDIAPGWQLVLTGGGTATVQQIVTLANEDQTNNPPYALRIITNGTTTAELIQTFNGTGVLFASVTGTQNGYVSGSITARGISGNYPITLNYETDNLTEIQLAQDDAVLNSFTVIDGINLIPVVDPLDTFPNDQTSVSFIILLQNSGTVDISNVQMTGELVPIGTAQPTVPLYQQESLERQIDHFYHLERSMLFQKPIPSYLIGWDFPLNPAQIVGSTVAVQNIGANKSFHPWDQTIIFQSVNNSISTSREASGGIALTAAVNTQFAMIQYLDGNQVRELLRSRMAVNISAVTGTGTIPATLSLWYTTGTVLPNLDSPSFNSIVLTLDSNGHPATLNQPTGGVWTEITVPINGNQNTSFSFSNTPNYTNYNFSGFDATANTSGPNSIYNANYFAIVIGTGTVSAGQTLFFQSVGLMSGDIATRPAPQSISEVLRDCQYYYEKSYDNNVIAGTTTRNGAQIAIQIGASNGSIIKFTTGAFGFTFNGIKRVIPKRSFYSTDGSTSLNSATALIFSAPGGGPTIVESAQNVALETGSPSNWILDFISTKSIGYRPGNNNSIFNLSTSNSFYQNAVIYQYVMDARLGVV